MSYAHRLTTADAVRDFALAGNATLTLLSRATGVRFTYKIRQPEEHKPHFVGLLRGADNENDFQFIGTIFKGPHLFGYSYKPGRNSRVSGDAPSAKAFAWFWKKLRSNALPDSLEVWHEGRCGRCGRKLTVPESIESGFGPECASILGLDASTQVPLPGMLQRQA
jgi:hypothetical protein